MCLHITLGFFTDLALELFLAITLTDFIHLKKMSLPFRIKLGFQVLISRVHLGFTVFDRVFFMV